MSDSEIHSTRSIDVILVLVLLLFVLLFLFLFVALVCFALFPTLFGRLLLVSLK
jgi:hypothetical protein